jgi:hypothetical protein
VLAGHAIGPVVAGVVAGAGRNRDRLARLPREMLLHAPMPGEAPLSTSRFSAFAWSVFAVRLSETPRIADGL